MLNRISSVGAPVARVAPLLLAIVLAATLQAQEPEVVDWLAKSRTALVNSEKDALSHAVRALKAKPLGAEENVQACLALFWMGQFDDSARHLRRALSADAAALAKLKPLAALMPGQDAQVRIVQVGKQAEAKVELCFLTGALLLVNRDRTLALPFIVRAEELAGTDAQASKLIDADDRNVARGTAALRAGDWADAVTGFAFAALDAPAVAEHYAGLAIALAASREFDLAEQMLTLALAKRRGDGLLPWLTKLKPSADPLGAIARDMLTLEDVPSGRARVAAAAAFSAGYYATARKGSLRVLGANRLDDFAHDLMDYSEANNLSGDPRPAPGEPDPAPPAPTDREPDTPTEPRTVDDARAALRRGDYTAALKALDTHINEDAEPALFHLLFAIHVGRGEFGEGATALQTWFLRANREERVKLNAVRELFATTELFERWRKKIIDLRTGDPNAGVPRLINAYVELTRGRYQAARDELVVAKSEAPANPMVQALDRLLQEDDFKNDVTPNGVPNDMSPRALQGKAAQLFKAADYEGARSHLLRALEADPALPHAQEDLLRCYFALGDYDAAARKLDDVFEARNLAKADVSAFRILIVEGYGDTSVFETHLKALRDKCDDKPLAWQPFLLLGVIEFDQRRYEQAAKALQKYHDMKPGERSAAALRLLEHARKRGG
jgi:tetratricopeptide (TPR) repeat protein